MDPALVFQICNTGVLPFWALLVLAPRWWLTERVVHAAYVPLALAVVYAVSIAAGAGGNEGGSFGSLAGVMAFFAVPEAALAGWIHYLAFDLFVGAWESRDAQRRNIPHPMVVPCLLLTLMLGPIGLALYLLLRLARAQGPALTETQET